jgi:hypothetical protein
MARAENVVDQIGPIATACHTHETKPSIVHPLCRNNGFYGVANRLKSSRRYGNSLDLHRHLDPTIYPHFWQTTRPTLELFFFTERCMLGSGARTFVESNHYEASLRQAQICRLAETKLRLLAHTEVARAIEQGLSAREAEMLASAFAESQRAPITAGRVVSNQIVRAARVAPSCTEYTQPPTGRSRSGS